MTEVVEKSPNPVYPWEEEKLGPDTWPYLSEGVTREEAEMTVRLINRIVGFVAVPGNEKTTTTAKPFSETREMFFETELTDDSGAIKITFRPDNHATEESKSGRLIICFGIDVDQSIQLALEQPLKKLEVSEEASVDRPILASFDLYQTAEGNKRFSLPVRSLTLRDNAQGCCATRVVWTGSGFMAYDYTEGKYKRQTSDRIKRPSFMQNFPTADKRACLRTGLEIAVEAIEKAQEKEVSPAK